MYSPIFYNFGEFGKILLTNSMIRWDTTLDWNDFRRLIKPSTKMLSKLHKKLKRALKNMSDPDKREKIEKMLKEISGKKRSS